MISDKFWAHGIKVLGETYQCAPPEEQQKAWRAVLDVENITDEDFGRAIKYIITNVKQWFPSFNLAAMILEWRSDVKPFSQRIANSEPPKQLQEPRHIGELLSGFHRMLFDRANEVKRKTKILECETIHDYCERCQVEAIQQLERENIEIPAPYKAWLREYILKGETA